MVSLVATMNFCHREIGVFWQKKKEKRIFDYLRKGKKI